MNARQWSEFVTQSGIQADRRVKTFTPVWNGFSVDPIGDFSYFDFGHTVTLWWDANSLGTSDSVSMAMSLLPESIRPTVDRIFTCMVSDDGVPQLGMVQIFTSGSVQWYPLRTNGTPADRATQTSFTASGSKGLVQGFSVTYAK